MKLYVGVVSLVVIDEENEDYGAMNGSRIMSVPFITHLCHSRKLITYL